MSWNNICSIFTLFPSYYIKIFIYFWLTIFYIF